MRSIGIGRSVTISGMTNGTMPSIAYLARINNTRTKYGIAGYGMPLKSITSITAVRSLPLTVRTEWPASEPGETWWSSITPSISTLGMPLIVATMTTRMIGGIAPPESRKMVCSGERLLNVNFSSKPLAVSPEAVVTVTLVSASSTDCGAGMGTAGPIINVRSTPLSIGYPRNAFRQSDAQSSSEGLGQLFRSHRAVGVADAPELLRIAEIPRRDVVQSLAF